MAEDEQEEEGEEESDELTDADMTEDYQRLQRIVDLLDSAMKELSRGLNDGDLYEELFKVLRDNNNRFVKEMSDIGAELA
jgi:hypothetical protein